MCGSHSEAEMYFLEVTVPDEPADLLSDSQHILNAWKVFGIHVANDVKQTDVHTYIVKPNPFEAEIVIEHLKRCKSTGKR
jgi:hypothetical protein